MKNVTVSNICFKEKRVFLWFFARLFVPFSFGEDRLHLGNKRKKTFFSLYFAQFALSLQEIYAYGQ